MGSPEDRRRFVEQVRKASGIAEKLRELGIRPYGIVRIDSATDPASWAKDPEGTKKISVDFFASAARSLVSLVPRKKDAPTNSNFFSNPVLIQPNQLEQ